MVAPSPVDPRSGTGARSGGGSPYGSKGQAGPLSSQDLLQGRQELLIVHGDCVYRLRHTRNGKLILTK